MYHVYLYIAIYILHHDVHYISCDSPQLTVECHKKKTAPSGMRRGSATTDDQFAYFTPLDSNSVYIYHWNTENWENLPPSPYDNSGLVVIDGELTAVGGWDRCGHTNKIFTLRQDRWVEHYPPMNTARSSPAVVSTSDSNYIVVIGGSVGVNTLTATYMVELFHVRSGIWYELPQTPVTRPSAAICSNQLHVIGRDGTGYSCSLQALLSSDQQITSQLISNILTWTPLPQQPVQWSTAATLCGLLVIVGGERNRSLVNSIHQLMDGQWVEIGSMSSTSGRSHCLVVSPSPDKMLIVGGVEGYKISDCVEECVVL